MRSFTMASRAGQAVLLSLSAATLLLAACAGEADVRPPAAAIVAAPKGSTPSSGPAAPLGPPSAAAVAETDEGMWLLNDFPADRVGRRHGFSPKQEWLDRVRLSSVRLALGCSGSLVSADGLVMTNHHCAEQCIAQLSTKENDLMAKGFLAEKAADERKCPGMEVNQLVEITDVTARVLEATRGTEGRAYVDALKGVTATIEKECASADKADKADLTRCDLVTLYRGGRYHLYRYKRFQDVRLVFAPEDAIASFGGDPDNFNFPRYALDLSFLRVYEADKPLKPAHHFPWSKTGAKEGELTFVSGHPGRTSRQLTMAQLVFKRDVELPNRLMWLAELRGVLHQFAARGPEEKRTSMDTLHYIENGLKALRGRREALVNERFMATKQGAELALRAYVDGAAALSPSKGAWDAIEKSQADARRLYVRFAVLEGGSILNSDLFGHARTIVRAADELAKKNEERLPELTDSKLPGVKANLLADAPVHVALERVMLEHGLTKLRELLGADDPLVKRVFGKRSPGDVAAQAVAGTKLRDKAARKALFDGGKAAVAASTDPMIALAKALDDDARAVRKEWEDKVDAVVKKSAELIAKARFAQSGTSQYPDATFSLRLSYGTVKGFSEGGREVKPFTTLGGAFERATGREPFALPKRWLGAQAKLDLATPFDFVTTNDIIGGNSGSPVINKEGEVVGLIFDGNIHSLGNDFGYDGEKGRAVAVHTAGILQALEHVYGAKRVLGELVAPK